MNIGKAIANIRKEHSMTQEDFGKIFHVTRQTVSNWENEKSYPDLQTLVSISDRFNISLDTLLKEDEQMIKTIDKERFLGTLKREKPIISFFTGAGTGIILSCLSTPDSAKRMILIAVGILLLGIGWYKKAKQDKKILLYLEGKDTDI